MDQISKFKGTYQLSTKWGGATGVWKTGAVLTVSASGRVYIGTTLLPTGNVTSSAAASGGTQFRLVFPDGSVAQFNFVKDGARGYYFDSPFQGTGLTGALQPNDPASGGLDLSGVPTSAIIPSTTADLLVPYQGVYQLATKWGGVSGKWETFKILTVSAAGEISVDSTPLPAGNVTSTPNATGGTQFRVVFPDSSVAQFSFAMSGSAGYYFDNNIQGACLTGVYQPNDPASGGLDLRGVSSTAVVVPAPPAPTPPTPTPPTPTPPTPTPPTPTPPTPTPPTPAPAPTPTPPVTTPFVTSGGPAGISVKLVNSAGVGLKGAVVSFLQASSWKKLGETGADGMLTSSSLAAGSQRFLLSYKGQSSDFGPVAVTSGSVVVFTTVPVDVMLSGGTGSLAPANITFRGNEGFFVGAGSSDANGLCSLQLLPGKYLISADFRTQTNYQDATVNGATVVKFPLVPMTVKLTGGNASMKGGTVTHMGNDNYWAGDGLTGDDASVSFYLLPGTYVFGMSFRNHVAQQSGVVVGTSGGSVSFSVVPTTVTVKTSSGALVANAVVQHLGSDTSTVGDGTTSANGTVTCDLLAGDYTLIASKDGASNSVKATVPPGAVEIVL